jgi:hypothetical protein
LTAVPGVGVALPIADSVGHSRTLTFHFPREGERLEFGSSGRKEPWLAL